MKCRGVGIGREATRKFVTKVAEIRGELLCMVTVCELEVELLLTAYLAIHEEAKSAVGRAFEASLALVP